MGAQVTRRGKFCAEVTPSGCLAQGGVFPILHGHLDVLLQQLPFRPDQPLPIDDYIEACKSPLKPEPLGYSGYASPLPGRPPGISGFGARLNSLEAVELPVLQLSR